MLTVHQGQFRLGLDFEGEEFRVLPHQSPLQSTVTDQVKAEGTLFTNPVLKKPHTGKTRIQW